jgi:cytoskeletal protein RodZ
VPENIEDILTPEFGAALARARQERHLTVADVAARLRINPQFVGAMEAGNWRILPPDPYRKAFVKEYAKLVAVKLSGASEPAEKRSMIAGVPEAAKKVAGEAADLTREVIQSTKKTTENVVQKLEEGVKDAVEEIRSKDLWEEADEVRKERLGIRDKAEELPTGFNVRKRETPVPPAPLGRSRSYSEPLSSYQPPPQEPEYEEEYEEENYRQGMSTATKVIIGLLVVIAAVVGYSIISKKHTPETVQPQVSEEPKKEPPKPKPAATETKPETSPPDTVKQAAADSLVFSVTATDSVWLSVSPDVGSGGFRGLMQKGDTKRFAAKDKFFVFIGNQKVLKMTLDGKPVSNLPTTANSTLVVRNLVISRDKIYISEAEMPQVKQNTPAPERTNMPPQSKKNSPPAEPAKKPVQPVRKPINQVKPKLPGAN